MKRYKTVGLIRKPPGYGEGEEVESLEVSGRRSESRANRKRAAQAKLRSTTQRLGSRTKPRMAMECLTTRRPVLLGGFGRSLPGVVLVDIGQFARVAGHLLHRLGQRDHLRTVDLVGRRHLERQQMAQRVDRDVHLGLSGILCVRP
ncbi:MAG: hypothetical protein JWM91_3244 [Rhodospirillales bacterium]|nr:hypothetical protein [Rhodospirillales bacterium]